MYCHRKLSSTHCDVNVCFITSHHVPLELQNGASLALVGTCQDPILPLVNLGLGTASGVSVLQEYYS